MSRQLGRLSNVTKLYGFQAALRAVDLNLETGEFLSVVGPNGAGKTTLLRILAGLSQPSRGEIELTIGRHGIGYLSHQSLLYGELTGLENLLFWARIYEVDPPVEKCRHMLESVQMGHVADQQVRSYSQGMKQRLSLARALINDPSLLLLDEPYSGLDRHGSRLLSALLKGVHQRGRTVVLVTHNLDEGVRLADRVVLLDRGAVLLETGADQLDPASFERTYLDVLGGREGSQ